MAKKSSTKKQKLHSWRMCPQGEHWVEAHPLKVPISKKNPDGLTIRRGHCQSNPSKKDQLYADEIHAIEENYFGRLRKLPTGNKLGRPNGNEYDRVIAGWAKYWNEVLAPDELLDSNLVKALISTETDFRKIKRLLLERAIGLVA